MVVWPHIASFLLVGYLCMSRSFAYLGVPPLFIGEIVLGAFVLVKPRVALGTWWASLLRPSPLNELGLALLLFLAYGVWQVARGVLGGSPILHTLKFFIFNYYSIYIFLGLWIGLRAPEHLPRLIRILAWVNGVYGVVYILALRHAAVYVPGTEIPLFGVPAGGAVAIAGLLCFERDLRAVWLILVLNIVVVLAWQVRAEWFGLGVGILVWGFLTGRAGRVVAIGLAGLAVLGMIELADVRLAGRQSGVSLSETLARAIAPIDLELARKLSPNAESHASTADWRELWWEQIWASVHSKPILQAFGHGYGFDLFSLAPLEIREYETNQIRTPHSIFYYALGYTGWVGVALFGFWQLAILRLLWWSYRVDGQPAGVVFWVMGISMAFFEGNFDTPYRGIPFYLLVGMAAAPALRFRQLLDAHHARRPDMHQSPNRAPGHHARAGAVMQ
jgi:O-Antigen ligase